MRIWPAVREEFRGAWRSVQYDLARRGAQPRYDGGSPVGDDYDPFEGGPRRVIVSAGVAALIVGGAAGSYFGVLNGLGALLDRPPAPAALPAVAGDSDEVTTQADPRTSRTGRSPAPAGGPASIWVAPATPDSAPATRAVGRVRVPVPAPEGSIAPVPPAPPVPSGPSAPPGPPVPTPAPNYPSEEPTPTPSASGGPPSPSEPADPSESGQPSEPADPSESGQPSESADPAYPAQPDGAAESDGAAHAAGTDDPGQSGRPSQGWSGATASDESSARQPGRHDQARTGEGRHRRPDAGRHRAGRHDARRSDARRADAGGNRAGWGHAERHHATPNAERGRAW